MGIFKVLDINATLAGEGKIARGRRSSCFLAVLKVVDDVHSPLMQCEKCLREFKL